MSENRPLVLVTYALPSQWLSKLKGRVRVVIAEKGDPGFSDKLRDHFAEAAGALTMLAHRVDEALLDQLPNLKVVSNMAVGVDNINILACTRRGIKVGHTPGVLTDATADMAVALLLASARVIPEASKDAREGRWDVWTPTGWMGRDLRGAAAGIIGLGNIGTAVAHRLAAFGCRILYTSRSPKPAAEKSLGATRVPLNTLLEKSDFVVVAVDLNNSTRGLIDEAALQQMKQTATLINIARGPVVDTGALVKALELGWIGAAALDVTDPEPLPSDHPLYAFPNCLITPHIASATEGTRRRMAELACENLIAGVKGQALVHAVN